MTLSELERYYIKSLSSVYDKGEATAITRFAMEELLEEGGENGLSKGSDVVSEEAYNKAESVLGRLMKHEPVQYVFEAAWFCNMKLKVNSSVLIPRPETEELVHLIQQTSPSNARILDIGTGSGCIALGLKKFLPQATVAGIDNSEEALTVARRNSTHLRLAVNFHHLDIFNHEEHLDFINTYEKFEIIVSNPPYIPAGEKSSIASNVIKYEPHEALFVDGNDPLVYYNVIADFAKKFLTNIGQLFFEVHRDKAVAVMHMLQHKGFRHVNVITDMAGNDRFVVAHLR